MMQNLPIKFLSMLLNYLLSLSLIFLSCSKSDVSAQDIPEIQPGDQQLKLSAIRPFSATYKNYNRRGEYIGMINTRIEPVGDEESNSILWTCSIEMQQGTIVDSVIFDAKTIAPIYRSFPKMSSREYWYLNMTGANVEATIKSQTGEFSHKKFKLEQPFFESSLLEFVLAALPLKEGYGVKLPYGDYSKTSVSWVVATVNGREQIVSESGAKYDAWAVELEFANGSKRGLWIHETAPFRVKSRGGWNWKLVDVKFL